MKRFARLRQPNTGDHAGHGNLQRSCAEFHLLVRCISTRFLLHLKDGSREDTACGLHNMMPQQTIELRGFDAAIFDLDGVITQTAHVHAAAWKQVFDAYLRKRATQTGEPFQAFDPLIDYRDFVDGKPRYDGVSSFFTSRGIHLSHGEPSDPPDHDTICGLGNRKNAAFREAIHTCGVAVFPSTIALVRLLKSLGQKTAVVTASENGRAILQATGVTTLFDVIVDGRDARTLHLRGKPHPDTFVQAASFLQVQPQRAMVYEDALAGVEAARAGHFGLVVGLNRADQAEALQARGGDVVVPDVAELGVRDAEGTLWQSARTLPSALHHFEELSAAFRHTPVIVFLDYDGTLTPIVDRPDLAVLSQAMREALDVVSRHCLVGIISGRDRQDVTNLVKLNALIYAGSHGFDIACPDRRSLHHEVGAQFASTLDQAEKTLRNVLQRVSGSLVERKKFSIAVHYRLVAPDDVSHVEAAVARLMTDFPDLRRSAGKKVFEIQPQVEWDKGKALLWLLDRLQEPETNAYPLYIGDDLTDEDAFRALGNRGASIVVENGDRFSSARYALHNPDEVRHFLIQLGQHRAHTNP